MTTEVDILEGLCDELRDATITGSPDIAWPGVPYTPDGTLYLRVSHMPNTVEQVTLGAAGYNRHEGMFQVSVMVPKGTGEVTGRSIGEEISAVFKRGTTILRDTTYIRIIRPPVVGSAFYESDEAYIQIPVTVRYQVDAANP